ncbi:uncharacterized protein LOC103703997 [Phoenix dactylifera]|uniref:Uncharacterized protein LOC103703997 n=1 Tax=Phoenix dactylifera TaxID=42345 RepID=A0A8B9A1L9_PHODC|nr:uncharacterized protein LOC103703997 [Phoenix dactylifera]
MLQDVIHPSSEPLSIESPIAAQILDFYDDDGSDLFPHYDTQLLRSSDDVSTSYAAPSVSVSATTAPLCCSNEASFSPSAANVCSPFLSIDAATLSALLDAPRPPLPGVDHPSPTNPSSMFPVPPQSVGDQHQHQMMDPFAPIGLTDPIPVGGYGAYSPESVAPIHIGGPSAQQQALAYEEECLAAMAGGLVGLEAAVQPPSFAFPDGGGIGALYHQGRMVGGEGPQGFFNAGMMMVGPRGQVAEYQPLVEGAGNVGIYGPERVYGSGDLQQVIGGNQHLMGGCSGGPTPLPASDISALDESTFKVGRLSAEERKEKIHRYMKKRNERNFSKKIKYACRKTLADSRPRVRGRFAKNDEFGEATRPTSSHHEFDEEEEVVAKEEEDIHDSSDILAHISGVNSFKYNYTLESWI